MLCEWDIPWFNIDTPNIMPHSQEYTGYMFFLSCRMLRSQIFLFF